MPISLVIGIQDLYISKYKYTIMVVSAMAIGGALSSNRDVDENEGKNAQNVGISLF